MMIESALLRCVRCVLLGQVRAGMRIATASSDILERTLDVVCSGVRTATSVNVYFEGIHACFVHGVAGAILAVTGDEAPRLRFVRIIHIIVLL